MKTVALPIEMITYFKADGQMKPIRFKLNTDNESKVVNITRIIRSHKEKIAGNTMYVYDCQSIIDGVEKLFQLKFDVDTLKWILFKI